jgi:hypothetical protein
MQWNIKFPSLCQNTMASETTAPYLRLDQNDKLRIPTYQAEKEPTIFNIHSQVKRHKIHTKYKKLKAHSSHAVLHTLKTLVISVWKRIFLFTKQKILVPQIMYNLYQPLLPPLQCSQRDNVTLQNPLHWMFSVSHKIARQTPETVSNFWEKRKFQGGCLRNTWSSRNILASVLMTSFKGICPSSLLLDGNRGSLRGTKRPGCEADCLPPTKRQVQKEWRCTTVPPCASMERQGTNLSFIFVFLWFYIHLRWYDCQTQPHDSTTPTTNVFHKAAYRLDPNLLFRTAKYLTPYRIQLQDAEGKLVTKHVGTTASKI